MPDNQIHIAPNKPLYVALESIDVPFEDYHAVYTTTTAQTLSLPRPAVVALNMCEPRPGEEIVITQHWSGKRGESAEWTVALSTRSEKLRAGEDLGSATTLGSPEPTVQATPTKEAPISAPTPIRRPSSREQEPQPRLFDMRGTGTHGPAPAPIRAPRPVAARYQRPGQIPANVAVREILQFINEDPSTKNWGGDEKQDLLSTILIAAYKAGQVELWERGE